jgi:hypothetical protein
MGTHRAMPFFVLLFVCILSVITWVILSCAVLLIHDGIQARREALRYRRRTPSRPRSRSVEVDILGYTVNR